jgi:hypothetical protein
METKYKLLKTAYDNFGKQGPKSLVASLKSLGLNDFENLNDLQDQLIRKHLINTEIFLLACEKELTSFPKLFQLLAQFPETLRFNKQIFLHRSNPVYNELFIQITKLSPGSLLSSFSDFYQLSSDEDAINLIKICLESWFSKIDTDHINAQKMFQQFDAIINTLLQFKKSSEFSNSKTIY